jgi:peptidoglycan hydrolase-like protein with peptidoglycan-binding domain
MTDYPTYWEKRVTIDKIVASKTFEGLHPTMQERVRGLIEASGGKVGLGQGLRDSTQQLQMFLSRHVPDPSGTIFYDGKKWRRLPGVAAAAPPGMSMHEIGLAADMTGDMGWVGDNAARFNLQTFANVNSEPWHVQPSELPRGRAAYQKKPEWGLPPWTGAGDVQAAATGTATPATTSAPSSTPSSTPAAVSLLTPALRALPGDSGPAVAVLAEALIARGLLPDAPASRIDVYTPEVAAIVEEFQRSNALKADRMVGPQTWGSLLKVVKPGEEGAHARVLQVTLIVRGLLKDAAGNRDGVYGSATQEIVRQFQTLAGLGADAEVGPQTWTALIGERKRIAVTTRGGDDDEVDADEIDLDDIDLLALYDGLPAE